MRHRNILIIDQDRTRRKDLKENILAPAGYSVIAVDSPDHIPPGTFSVILLAQDIGDRLGRLLKQFPASPLIYLENGTPDTSGTAADLNAGLFTRLGPNPPAGAVLKAVRLAEERREQLVQWAGERTGGELFPILQDAVILTDPEGRLQFMNDAARTILNLEPSGWEARPIQDLVDMPELTGAILANGNNTASHFIFQPTGWEPHAVQITTLPGFGKVTTLHNIAHYKEMDALRTELIQMISHDLRSPLTAILGYIELVAKVGPVSSEQEDFIHRARLSVNVITEFIDSLLELSLIDADPEHARERVSLPAILNECQITLQPLFDSKQQSIAVHAPEDLPQVYGRPNRLRQMVINLLENANKYTEAGGHISITARKEGDQVLLEIKDDGIGIPSSEIPFIFDKMYRAQNIPLEMPGSGLGLAIVKSIVDNHSGRLWCESSEGKGTTFTILLPAAPPSA